MAQETLKDWEEHIRLAKAYQAEHGRLERWKENRDFYDNKYPDGVISVNLVFSIGRALVPQLYFKSPNILVTPRKPRLREQAKILEAIDRWLIPHMGLKYQIKQCILDAYLTNVSILKFGYHSIGSEFPADQTEEEMPSLLKQAMDAFLAPMKAMMGLDSEAEDEANRKLKKYSYHDWIKPDCPWALRWPTEDFLVPYGTVDIAAAPWCAFRLVRPLEDVQRDPVYSHTRSLKATGKLGDPMPGKPTGGSVLSPQYKDAMPKVPMLEYYELWDKRDGRVKVLVEGHQHWLRNDVHNLNMDGLPVEIMQFNPNGRDFWGVADVDQIKAQVKEYNETRTLEIMHKRTAITKFLFNETAIDDTELAKFTSGQISAVKMKENPVGNVMPITVSMSRDLYNMSDVIRDDVREVIGYARNQVGEFEASRRTATEAAIVQQALQLRADERRDQVADLLGNAFQRKIHPMLFDFWGEERTIEVTALGGWVEYTGEQIRGDYDVSVTADSIVPLSRAQRQQTALVAFKELKNDPRIDQHRLYGTVLEQYDDVLPGDLLLPPEQAQQNMLVAALQQLSQAQPKAGQRPQLRKVPGGQQQGAPLSAALAGGR